MDYIIRLDCINENNPYKLRYGQEVYVSEVFGLENKCTKNKSLAYKFISIQRVQSIVQKISQNHIFRPIVLKVH